MELDQGKLKASLCAGEALKGPCVVKGACSGSSKSLDTVRSDPNALKQTMTSRSESVSQSVISLTAGSQAWVGQR